MPDHIPDLEALSPLVRTPLTFPVVGIGGSAGGLQALLSFFEHMPPEPGMAFVVILHLSPDHESNAAAILQRVTAMPVTQVKTSIAIEIDHIYVIAPGADLLMNDGHLQMAATVRAIGPAVAIDVFFRTLAQVHRTRGICIVLSGTGSDGAVGLARVKEEGGITLAQLEDDAEHGDMPRAAIATGMVDFVLPAAAMGVKLVELWTNAQRIQLPNPEALNAEASADSLVVSPAHEQVLLEIMGLLRSYTRHDFRHYKRGTVVRRIERRLQVNGLKDLTSYRDYLRSHPAEATPLLQDMLISVTSFFRDAKAFDVLEHDVLPQFMENRARGEPSRIWIAGCATGEESYSLSILMREQAQAQPGASHSDVQIFATDIDERAIATARRGVYPSGIAADVSEARLQKFFVQEQGQYRITADIREQVLFATHNLLRDPPFSRLDLICCRNLLIYLDASAQTSVLEMFRYALKPGGYLFLGTSESADAAGGLFTVVDKKNRIFRVDPNASTRGHTAYIHDRAAADNLPFVPTHALEPTRAPQPQAAATEHLMALQSVSPASILINDDFEVLHLSPTAGRFMTPGGGIPSNNLLNNVEPDLRLELRTALFKARQPDAPVHGRVDRTRADGRAYAVEIAVHALPVEPGKAPRTLVVFREEQVVTAQTRADDLHARDTTHQMIVGKLEDDNRQLKVLLQDTLERSALSTEELKASNEELQAINEELRSATEELETSKEELQSMNEELGTVNLELRAKVEERGQINDDLHNLISSSEVATVFVDSNMCIKRFTPQASKLFNLIASDIGRSLLDITNRLNYGELATDAQAVFKDLRVIEREITTTDDRCFFARILPYRTTTDKIEGAVLTFFDVTALKLAEQQVRDGEERLRVAAANTSDFAIITSDEAGTIATWNTGAERIFGWRPDEIVGRGIATIFTPEDRAAGVPEAEMALALEAGRAEDEGWRQRKDGSTFYCSGVLTRLQSSVGKGFAKIARDLTGSKRHELARENLLLKEQQASSQARRDVEMKDKFLAVMSHELKQPLNLIQVSAELLTRLPETREVPSALRIGSTIQRAVSSQTKIINDLLDLSRARTGKLRLNLVEVDLGELLRLLAHAAAGDLERKAITLTVSGPARLQVVCDRVRVEQVIWNLIGNSIKFTPAGGQVTVSLEAEGACARITVTDTGCGIAAEFLPHVFEMFNQAAAQLTPSNGGLGIGLALVQELAQAHGGRVEVASDGLALGATFTVWLPLVPVMVPERAMPADAPAISVEGWRILAVDDDRDSLNAFATLLRLEGATVNVAEAPAIALELLEGADYDLLISDISMPGMDGHDFITEVRRRLPDRRLKAVAMSGYGRAVDAERATAAGFDAHIPKPASIDQLKAVIAQLAVRHPEGSRASPPAEPLQTTG